VNSEELELSLRSEFDSYLKSVLAEMRQEASEFQGRVEAEFNKQKTQFDEAFREFSARFDSERSFDEGFRGTVSEHLRLARDDGARITANAIAEAEDMERASAPPAPVYDVLRDAVADICGKDSQSSILKSLVEHACQFAARGAFFIIKSEHFVGWKAFDSGGESANTAIRDIHFPMSADSILGAAASSRSTVDGSATSYSQNYSFTEPLQFGESERMYAIPLIARGRGVAVLYADHGTEGGNVNREALETIVRVAGLTVELLAASQTAKAENRTVGAADFEEVSHPEASGSRAPETPPRFSDSIQETSVDISTADEQQSSGFSFNESTSYEGGFAREIGTDQPFESKPADEMSPPADGYGDFGTGPIVETPEYQFETEAQPVSETPSVEKPVFARDSYTPFGTPPPEPEVVEESKPVNENYIFDSGGSIESAAFEKLPFDRPAGEYEPAAAASGGGSGFGQMVEPVVQAPAVAVPMGRSSDRPVDLPIEVPEDERRIHNDARRFARLLVSEIKLYNEKKVTEGRDAQDLYERLREAIDRSREMYDKRVQAPVAAKFDYFHYELVNSLADGDSVRLGSSYPGSTV